MLTVYGATVVTLMTRISHPNQMFAFDSNRCRSVPLEGWSGDPTRDRQPFIATRSMSPGVMIHHIGWCYNILKRTPGVNFHPVCHTGYR